LLELLFLISTAGPFATVELLEAPSVFAVLVELDREIYVFAVL
jgi:hypothetical protein